jgi:hypothetical protein
MARTFSHWRDESANNIYLENVERKYHLGNLDKNKRIYWNPHLMYSDLRYSFLKIQFQ